MTLYLRKQEVIVKVCGSGLFETIWDYYLLLFSESFLGNILRFSLFIVKPKKYPHN